MSNGLQIFNNPEFGQVRTILIDSVPWFVGKDVAESLGYTNPQKAIRDHIDEEDKTVNDSFTVNGTKGILINESGLYALIFGSRLDSAKRFKRWVTSEVLPTLRMTGYYEMQGRNFNSVGGTLEANQFCEKMEGMGYRLEEISKIVGEVCEYRYGVAKIFLPVASRKKQDWKVPDEQLHEYVQELKRMGREWKKGTVLPVQEFNDFCACHGISPIKFKRWLYQNCYISGQATSQKKLEYTINVWIDGGAKRCILFR